MIAIYSINMKVIAQLESDNQDQLDDFIINCGKEFKQHHNGVVWNGSDLGSQESGFSWVGWNTNTHQTSVARFFVHRNDSSVAKFFRSH